MIIKNVAPHTNLCYNLIMKIENLTNQKFNKLLVLRRLPNQGKKVMWECLCDCGNLTSVTTSNLKSGRTKSCGCLRINQIVSRSTTHNQRHTNLYEVWKTIKQRCCNPNSQAYKNYGARGISICNEWKIDFNSFYLWSMSNGYRKGLTIDRIDFNGNYEPSNCRWVDRLTQANNTRTNVFIEFNNEIHTIAEWSRIYNIKPTVLYCRLRKGWSLEKSVTEPIKHRTII